MTQLVSNAQEGKWTSLNGNLNCTEINNLAYSPITKSWYASTSNTGCISLINNGSKTAHQFMGGQNTKGGDIDLFNNITTTPNSSGKFTEKTDITNVPSVSVYYSGLNLEDLSVAKFTYSSQQNENINTNPYIINEQLTNIINQLNGKELLNTPFIVNKYNGNILFGTKDSIWECTDLTNANNASVNKIFINDTSIGVNQIVNNAIIYGSEVDINIILTSINNKLYIRSKNLNALNRLLPETALNLGVNETFKTISSVKIHPNNLNYIALTCEDNTII